jgi:hypothetical protein
LDLVRKSNYFGFAKWEVSVLRGNDKTKCRKRLVWLGQSENKDCRLCGAGDVLFDLHRLTAPVNASNAHRIRRGLPPARTAPSRTSFHQPPAKRPWSRAGGAPADLMSGHYLETVDSPQQN